MHTLARQAEERIRQAHKERIANLSTWTYGSDNEGTCPYCFSTWIAVRYVNGWERLACCECNVQEPIPKACVAEARIKIIALALIVALRQPRKRHTVHERPREKHPRPRHAHRYHASVAW